MQSVISIRMVSLSLAALLTVAAGFSATAAFSAPAPGANLEPVGDAGTLVDLVQGREQLLWTALSGTVTSYMVLGWPSSHGDVDLGGALVIERPANGSAGEIELVETPMSATFELER